MDNFKSKVLFSNLYNKRECEQVIRSLLSIDNIYVDSDNVYADSDDDENGYIWIDDIIKIIYDNKIWTISYFLEYGPLDKYAIFEIEQHALFSYYAFKKCFNDKPTVSHTKDFPSSEISISYSKSELTNEFVRKIYECSKIVSSFYYGDPSIFKDNIYYEIIKNQYDIFLLDLTFKEYICLKNELEYVGLLHFLLVSGYESNSELYDLYQIYTNGEIKVGLTDVFLCNNAFYNATIDKRSYAKLKVELNNYLILICNEKQYIVTKEGYYFLKSIINVYNDTFEDSDDVNFYITEDYELIMSNSVFSVVQKAYAADPVTPGLIASEVTSLEKDLCQIKGIEYFDESNIIKRFEDLINSDCTSEYEIESYIQKHYRIILGKQYTKVVTQALASFIANEKNEERRFDIFVYHESNSDWDLFELKKSNVKIIKKIRGIYSLQSKIQDGIAQLRYYKEILSKEDVKSVLKSDYNIEYAVPKFKLIIGSGNDVNIRKCEEQVNDIEISTYTQLIEMAKSYNE